MKKWLKQKKVIWFGLLSNNALQIDNALQIELTEIFGKDLTIEIAEPFVNGLFSKISSMEDVFSTYYILIRKIYNPIIYAFVEVVKNRCGESGAIPLCLARDAWPMYFALKGIGMNPSIAYLTRGIFGEEDEINKELRGGASKADILAYIKQETGGQPFIIVDAGMYGSLVKKLVRFPELEGKLIGVMYLFSKNPYIYGFLNELWGIDVSKLAEISIDTNTLNAFTEGTLNGNTTKYILANIIIDSLECIHPMPMGSPTTLIKEDGTYRPLLKDQGKPGTGSQQFLEIGWKAMERAYSNPAGRMMSMMELLHLVKKARLEFTGILPTITPEWSKKPEFLKKWDVGKLWPLGNGGATWLK